MPRQPDFDVVAAHRFFAADCFNRAWDLITKTDRTAEEGRLMESLGQASIFHWTRRPDCTDRNMSIGYWQVSRIAAILGHAAEARRHGETCLAYSGALDPFYQGYAHEALARAALVACDAARAAEHLAKAEALLAEVTDKESRDLLTPDLAELRRGAG